MKDEVFTDFKLILSMSMEHERYRRALIDIDKMLASYMERQAGNFLDKIKAITEEALK